MQIREGRDAFRSIEQDTCCVFFSARVPAGPPVIVANDATVPGRTNAAPSPGEDRYRYHHRYRHRYRYRYRNHYRLAMTRFTGVRMNIRSRPPRAQKRVSTVCLPLIPREERKRFVTTLASVRFRQHSEGFRTSNRNKKGTSDWLREISSKMVEDPFCPPT